MSEHILAIRRAIIGLQVGQSADVAPPGVAFAEIQSIATSFARARKIAIRVDQAGAGAHITRIEKEEQANRYPEIDALEVGQSVTIKLGRAFHQRVRQVASNRNKAGKVRLSCSVTEDGFIKVTRLPMTAEELDACPAVGSDPRPTKYNLDRLATEPQLRFDIPRADHHKLRMACTKKAATMGWTIRCRLQDDGGMLVYRTDVQAPQKAAA